MFKSKVESAIHCPSCRSPVEEHLDFCHRCGETLTAVLVDKPAPHHNYVFVAAAILTLAVAVIMGLTIYDFVQQYGVPAGADTTERAQRYISQGQEDRAINLLEESLQVRTSGRTEEQKVWRRLLDQALYSRGKRMAVEGKYRDAVTAFARISSDFASHEEVEKLISEYSDKGLPAVFGKTEDPDPALEKEKRPLSKLEKAVMTAVPGGNEHVDPLPSAIRPQAFSSAASDKIRP
jgi:hypothetical protein